MAILSFDLGGTKLAIAIFDAQGNCLLKQQQPLAGSRGISVSQLIADHIRQFLAADRFVIDVIGVAVPGMYDAKSGTVWAPNIDGWTAYPLMAELQLVAGDIPIVIDNDRACCILGETWKGSATGCKDAIFLTIGTGIGAGIMVDGHVLRGVNQTAGAIGWMALNDKFEDLYERYGCFEAYGSGDGMARLAQKRIAEQPGYNGILSKSEVLTASDVFAAASKEDVLAIQVVVICIGLWGRAAANLVSLLNPDQIIFGGGVFGPGVDYIPAIKKEADRWAQPLGSAHVQFTASALAGDACLYGAARSAALFYQQNNHDHA